MQLEILWYFVKSNKNRNKIPKRRFPFKLTSLELNQVLISFWKWYFNNLKWSCSFQLLPNPLCFRKTDDEENIFDFMLPYDCCSTRWACKGTTISTRIIRIPIFTFKESSTGTSIGCHQSNEWVEICIISESSGKTQ